jgi:predicted DNA-binding transcriptional regulator AlpA
MNKILQFSDTSATSGENREFVTAKELATKLGIPKAGILRLHRQGKLPSVVLGHKTIRFHIPTVLKAINAQGNGCPFI